MIYAVYRICAIIGMNEYIKRKICDGFFAQSNIQSLHLLAQNDQYIWNPRNDLSRIPVPL